MALDDLKRATFVHSKFRHLDQGALLDDALPADVPKTYKWDDLSARVKARQIKFRIQ